MIHFCFLQERVKTTDLKSREKNLKNLMEYTHAQQTQGGGSATERLSTTAMKQKLDNMKGCDWFQELSITIRRSKRTRIPRDR